MWGETLSERRSGQVRGSEGDVSLRAIEQLELLPEISLLGKDVFGAVCT